jgi:diguanylate cyclase (GGDEF)-like protein
LKLKRLVTRNPRELPHLEELQRTLVDDLYRRSATTAWFLLPALFILREIVRPAYLARPAVRWAFWTTVTVMATRWAMVLLARRRPASGLAEVRARHRGFLALTTLLGLGLTSTILLASPLLGFPEAAAVAVFLCGVHSVALGSMAASPPTYIAYVSPAMAALIWVMATHPYGSLHRLMVAVCLLYLPTLVIMCLYAHYGMKKVIVLGLELRDLALRDSLTGLPNRRFLTEFVDREAVQALREWRARPGADRRLAPGTRSVGLLILDLDGFKGVNDRHGHEAGDEVLRQLAQVVPQAVRQPDLLVRWGGDEFVVAARELPRDGVSLLAERIRARVADHPFRLASGAVVHLTCSIGFALFPFSTRQPELLGWEQVLGLADLALYEAKARGRDRVVGVVCGDAALGDGEGLLRAAKDDFAGALYADLIRLAPAAAGEMAPTAAR